MTEEPLPKSKFTYGDMRLDQLSHRELLDAVDAIWSKKNEEVDKLKAERDGLRLLLSSSLPVHSLWRGFAESACLMAWFAFFAYMLGRHA